MINDLGEMFKSPLCYFNKLAMNKGDCIVLYFDEKAHKYTDVYGNPYTSVTTVIGKYEEDFKSVEIAKACERIGKNPTHPKYNKYKGKTWKKLLVEWKKTSDDACALGNLKHNYFEDSIKAANGYKRASGNYINGRIATVPEIVADPNYGMLNLEYFRNAGVEKYYPTIYRDIAHITSKGFRIYAEVGVYDFKHLVSGLIDIFFYNPDKGIFLIGDWKTNNAPINFASGYYEKDEHGNITDNFIETDKNFNYPISNLPQSTGNKYSLQLEMYSWFASKFGIEPRGNILFHIRHDLDENGLNIVSVHNMPKLTAQVELIVEHHSLLNKPTKRQGSLFPNLKPVV